MRSKALLLALLFSVSVNVVPVATLTARFLLASRREAKRGQPLCERLALSGWQAQAMDSTRHCFATETGAVCVALHRERQTLVDLLSADQPDTQAIGLFMDRIDSLQSILQRGAVAAIIRKRQILSPEQAAVYLRLIREKVEGEALCPQAQRASGLNVEDCPTLQSECLNQRR